MSIFGRVMLLLGWNGRREPSPSVAKAPEQPTAVEWETADAPVPPAVREAPKRVLAVFRLKGEARGGFFHYDVIRGGWIDGLEMEIDTGGTFAVRVPLESPPLDIIGADVGAMPLPAPQRKRFLR